MENNISCGFGRAKKAISRVKGVRIFKFSVDNLVQVLIFFDPVERTKSYDLHDDDDCFYYFQK